MKTNRTRNSLGILLVFLLLGFTGCDSNGNQAPETERERISTMIDDLRLEGAPADIVASWEAKLLAPGVGDSVQVNPGGSDVYNKPNGTITDFVAAGVKGVVTRAKSGWLEVDLEAVLSGNVVPDGNVSLVDDGDPPGCEPNCPEPGDIEDVVMIGCSNTDNILNHWNSSIIDLNSPGGQSGKTIVSYGEASENKQIWTKFKGAIGPETDIAIYMICQRWDFQGLGRPGARSEDVPYSLPAGDSGSDLYSERELVENILGEMRFILNINGLSNVPVAVMPMHFYAPDNGDTNPCDRIGSNGILAQQDYVDDINAAGSQSSQLRPGQSFTPTALVNGDGSPWRMPAVVQGTDATSEGCHLNVNYVQDKLVSSFELMAAGL